MLCGKLFSLEWLAILIEFAPSPHKKSRVMNKNIIWVGQRKSISQKPISHEVVVDWCNLINWFFLTIFNCLLVYSMQAVETPDHKHEVSW